MSAMLEVRVLSGMHERASCEVANGATVGADPSCDIVLADQGIAPRAAQLRIAEQGWALASNQNDTAGEPLTPFNQPLALGSVWITVARRNDEWLPLPAANDAELPQSPNEGDHVPGSGGTDGDVGSQDGAEEDAAHAESAKAADEADSTSTTPSASPGHESPNAARATKRRNTWIIIVSVVLLVLAIMVAVIVAALPARNISVAEPSLVESTEASVGRITDVIDRLGLSSRLHVVVGPTGTITVQGWVHDAAEHESLAAALSQIWPMPAMRVTNVGVAVELATKLLSAFSVVLQPVYEGDGRITVQGVASSAREQAAALDAMRAQLPGLTILEGRIVHAPDVSRELSDRLAGAGLSGVGLSWQPHRLEVNASGLATGQLPALRDLLDEFNARYFDVAALSQAASVAESDTVPFVIRSVVGGPQPFIVLKDGSKLLEGGVHLGYRLRAVEPDRLVFDGPRPAVIMR